MPHTSYIGRRRASVREGGAAAANIMERGSRIVKRPRLHLHSGEGEWTVVGRRGRTKLALSAHMLQPLRRTISIPFQCQAQIFLICRRLQLPCRRLYRNPCRHGRWSSVTSVRCQVNLPFIRRYKCCRHQGMHRGCDIFSSRKRKILPNIITPYK